uniref:Uncharacterized protein n=1 Tax=Arundo donax TaxID=35708 RepID=A0A0A8Y8B1_ARUDO
MKLHLPHAQTPITLQAHFQYLLQLIISMKARHY